jgi:hypothetical protein
MESFSWWSHFLIESPTEPEPAPAASDVVAVSFLLLSFLETSNALPTALNVSCDCQCDAG